MVEGGVELVGADTLPEMSMADTVADHVADPMADPETEEDPSPRVTPLRISLGPRRVTPLRISLRQPSQLQVHPLRINTRELCQPQRVSPLRINRSRLHSTVLDDIEVSPPPIISPLTLSRIQTLSDVQEVELDVSIVHGDETVEIPGIYFQFISSFSVYSFKGTPQSSVTRRRKRCREPSPEQRVVRQRQERNEAGPSNLPTLVERSLLEMYAGQGIGGDRKIAVSEAVNAANRVPEDIKKLGYHMIKLYIDARVKKIEEHNANVLEEVRKDTVELREATRGWGHVICPECMDDVPWGNKYG